MGPPVGVPQSLCTTFAFSSEPVQTSHCLVRLVCHGYLILHVQLSNELCYLLKEGLSLFELRKEDVRERGSVGPHSP